MPPDRSSQRKGKQSSRRNVTFQFYYAGFQNLDVVDLYQCSVETETTSTLCWGDGDCCCVGAGLRDVVVHQLEAEECNEVN